MLTSLIEQISEDIVDTIREPLLILDQDLRVTLASRSFYDFFKVKPEETVGQLIYDLGNKQWDIPGLRELLETILPEKTSFDDYEVEHDFAIIGRHVMLLNARQIERGVGEERIILLAIEDITERKQLKDVLTESLERYRKVFETSTDGILLFEKGGLIIRHANQSIEVMLGYSKEEIIGKDLNDIGFPDDIDSYQEIVQTLKAVGILHYKDARIIKKTGQVLDADIYMVDRASLVQCNVRDVSERKKTEKILEEEKERVSKAILKGIEEGSASVEAIIITKDGRQMPYAFNAAILTNAQEKPVGISGVGRDITEHQRLESQLRHAQKMEAIGTLAGGIAHDFNNMLSVIMGYGTMVAATLETGSPAKEDMNEVLIAAGRATDLTQRLLVFSRKDIVAMMPVDINEIILGLKKMLGRIIQESIEFNIELGDMPLPVLADAGQIEQVLINLAVNSKDAMQEGGRLTISTGLQELDDEYAAVYGYGKPGQYALITVADTGQGMDAETQKKIFDPFFTTKGIGEGTGLGLAISYEIIKKHSGYTNIYSEPGHDTEFRIYLPLSKKAASPDKEKEAAAPVKHGNETVLVAEDDPSLRKLAAIVLESFGFSVIPAVDGEDAIAKFMENRERISIVMLDMIMPKKTGKKWVRPSEK